MNNGSTILFWLDPWNGSPLAQSCPELFSFARNIHINTSKVLSLTNTTQLMQLPLSEQAFIQFQFIQNLLYNRPTNIMMNLINGLVVKIQILSLQKSTDPWWDILINTLCTNGTGKVKHNPNIGCSSGCCLRTTQHQKHLEKKEDGSQLLPLCTL
jgi:hypothetical protein